MNKRPRKHDPTAGSVVSDIAGTVVSAVLPAPIAMMVNPPKLLPSEPPPQNPPTPKIETPEAVHTRICNLFHAGLSVLVCAGCAMTATGVRFENGTSVLTLVLCQQCSALNDSIAEQRSKTTPCIGKTMCCSNCIN